MVRVKSFLGCIQLETGGICLGWFFFMTFLIATSLFGVFGWLRIISSPHPLYTLVWLDVIIFWIIVIYASWLMIQGIKTKNPSKIQPFRITFIVTTVLLIIHLVYLVYKTFSKGKPEENETLFKMERDIFEIIDDEYDIAKIVLNLVAIFMSIYIFIFVDSLHKSVREFRNRFYVVAKL